MPSLLVIEILIGLLAVGATAQGAPVKLCNSQACDYCPNSLTTTGTGYPSCVIYDRDTVLGGKEADYPPEVGGSRLIYYDIGMLELQSNYPSLAESDRNPADLGPESECRTMCVKPMYEMI